MISASVHQLNPKETHNLARTLTRFGLLLTLFPSAALSGKPDCGANAPIRHFVLSTQTKERLSGNTWAFSSQRCFYQSN